jgi:hypothetical protein
LFVIAKKIQITIIIMEYDFELTFEILNLKNLKKKLQD